MTPHVQFTAIEKRFGRVEALRGVTLDVPRGCVLALLGPNGAGKSTLFGCLLGTMRASHGEVLLNGANITDEHRRRFGYVAERVALYAHRTVIDNAQFFTRLKGHHVTDAEQQLDRVGLREFRERKVRTLSKGLLQRLGLAIGLTGKPELLILDEPFNGLDPALLDQLHQILREENARGATLLISTHTMSAIEPLATHVAIVLDGQLAAFGTLDELRRTHGEQSLEKIYHRIAKQRAEPSHPDPLPLGGDEGTASGARDISGRRVVDSSSTSLLAKQNGNARESLNSHERAVPLPQDEGKEDALLRKR